MKPNKVINRLMCVDDYGLSDFSTNFLDSDNNFSFKHVVEPPAFLNEESDKWVDWALTHWSSRKDAEDVHWDGHSLYFTTYFKPPKHILEAIVKQIPKQKFLLFWDEEEGFSGVYELKGGRVKVLNLWYPPEIQTFVTEFYFDDGIKTDVEVYYKYDGHHTLKDYDGTWSFTKDVFASDEEFDAHYSPFSLIASKHPGKVICGMKDMSSVPLLIAIAHESYEDLFINCEDSYTDSFKLAVKRELVSDGD